MRTHFCVRTLFFYIYIFCIFIAFLVVKLNTPTLYLPDFGIDLGTEIILPVIVIICKFPAIYFNFYNSICSAYPDKFNLGATTVMPTHSTTPDRKTTRTSQLLLRIRRRSNSRCRLRCCGKYNQFFRNSTGYIVLYGKIVIVYLERNKIKTIKSEEYIKPRERTRFKISNSSRRDYQKKTRRSAARRIVF